jgi:hypothetical protein
MQFYLAQIDDRYGEYEWSTTILLRGNEDTIDELVDNIASIWYGDRSTTVEEGVYDNMDVYSQAGKHKEISEETYNSLKDYFNDLTDYTRTTND